MRQESPTLADLALRLFTTASNSCWAERGFSAMNHIHSDLRNRLSLRKTEQLMTISINRRALDDPRKQVHTLTEKEIAQIEADLALLTVDEDEPQGVEDITHQELNALFRQPGGLATFHALEHTETQVTSRGDGTMMHTKWTTVMPVAPSGPIQSG